jgi:hypothetical protein
LFTLCPLLLEPVSPIRRQFRLAIHAHNVR